ncbi:hypothetical protein [Faecalibaculum rodentium]|uniref:hypothetical protein n=1 Tax=Faecalibaculum rodentium TaxID=1702221 RepID=UPI0027305A47|nr:hypothetical protein [Faecalibaculum rodentium]
MEVFTPEELEEFRKEMSETRRQCREAQLAAKDAWNTANQVARQRLSFRTEYHEIEELVDKAAHAYPSRLEFLLAAMFFGVFGYLLAWWLK